MRAHVRDAYLAIDERCQRQVVKEVGEELPHIRIAILAQALIIEAIDLRDLAAFVIAAKDRYPITESHLCAERCHNNTTINSQTAGGNYVCSELDTNISTLYCDN